MEQYFSYNFLEVLNISIYIIAPRTCTVYPILSPYWFYPSKLEVKIVGPKDAVEISWDCPFSFRLKLMAYGINSMKYELWKEKVLRKISYPSFKGVSQKPYTCLGDSMWQGPKKLSSRATWADWTHWNKTVFPRKKMVGFIPPSWPIYTYIGHSILWVFWEDGEKRKKEKKRKSGKNKIDMSSILNRRFMLRLILRLFENWRIITFYYSIFTKCS